MNPRMGFSSLPLLPLLISLLIDHLKRCMNIKLLWSVVAALAVICGGCAHPGSSESLETSEKVSVLSDDQFETIAIVGLNDIHGALAPEKLKTKDTPAIDYERGGAAYLASQIKVLRQELGTRVLVLDAGDHFQGSIDSNLLEGSPMLDFFHEIKLDASVLGNHEFDFGDIGDYTHELAHKDTRDVRGVIKKRVIEARYPYLAANVYQKKGGTFPGVPGTKASVLLTAGRLKVGVIGLSTLDTPTTTRPEYVKGLEFRDMAKIAEAESKKLRAAGADIVLVLAHAGVFCDIADRSGRAIKTSVLKRESDLQSACDEKGEIPELIKKLPKGTIDGVVSGHTHSVVHHWIRGVPVIQSGTRNYYFTTLYLTYDLKSKKLRNDLTLIEGPIPVCPSVFAHQRNCNGDLPAPKNGRGSLSTPVFHGEKISADPAMSQVLAPIFEKTEIAKKRVLGRAARPIEHHRREESPLGNLVADALRDATHADVAIVNPGGIRANLPEGEIRYEDVFRALPFDNYVSTVEVTGKELLLLLRLTQNGMKGFFPTSNLRIRAIRLDQEPEKGDLNGNGESELWETNRVIEATFADGSPIESSKTYKLATLDFLVGGGDGLGYFFDQLPRTKIQWIAGDTVRDTVSGWLLKQTGALNTDANPLVSEAKPRLKLEAAPKRSGKSKKASRTSKKRKKRS